MAYSTVWFQVDDPTITSEELAELLEVRLVLLDPDGRRVKTLSPGITETFIYGGLHCGRRISPDLFEIDIREPEVLLEAVKFARRVTPETSA